MEIPNDEGQGESKRGQESRKISIIIRSREGNPKDVGRRDKGDTHSSGGIGDNATEVKRKSEDHGCRHIHSTDSEMCPFGVSKDPQKSVGDVDQGAKVK